MDTRKAPKLGERVFRTATFTREAINEEGRTAELAFCSEAPFERWYGREILACDKKSVRLDRLKDGAPLLLDHNPERQIGVIENARIEGDKMGRAVVRFSRSALGEEIFQDVRDGIRRCVSVGYSVHKFETDEDEEEYRAIDWEPYEISIVSMPADTTVGIGRAVEEPPAVDTARASMPTETAPAQVTAPDAARGVQVTAPDPAIETARRTEIRTLGKRFNMRDEADSAIDNGTSLGEFRGQILERQGATPAVQTSVVVGMNAKEERDFSLMKAVRELANGGLTGLEKESCEAAVKLSGRNLSGAMSLMLPGEIEARISRQVLEKRAQTAGSFTGGGALIQTQYGSLIELLRNRTALGQAGTTIMGGITGDLVMPVQTGAATAYWVGETATLTDTAAAWGQKTMTPKRCGGTIPFSRQFLAQSSLDAESILRLELMTVLNLLIDKAGIEGTGVAGQPVGLLNTAGIGSDVTYSGAATWANVLLSETKINTANGDIGTIKWLLSNTAVGKWKGILRSSVAGSKYLIDEDMTANGYPVIRTNQISTERSYFGVFSQLLLAMWAGTEIIVDPYTLATSNQVRITMQSMVDYLCRQPAAFQVSTDTPAT